MRGWRLAGSGVSAAANNCPPWIGANPHILTRRPCRYVPTEGKLDEVTPVMIAPMVAMALKIAKLPEYTGRHEPTVIA